jgi:hypothetical protein
MLAVSENCDVWALPVIFAEDVKGDEDESHNDGKSWNTPRATFVLKEQRKVAAGRSQWQWPSIEAACDGSAAPEDAQQGSQPM